MFVTVSSVHFKIVQRNCLRNFCVCFLKLGFRIRNLRYFLLAKTPPDWRVIEESIFVHTVDFLKYYQSDLIFQACLILSHNAVGTGDIKSKALQ